MEVVIIVIITPESFNNFILDEVAADNVKGIYCPLLMSVIYTYELLLLYLAGGGLLVATKKQVFI